MPLDYESLVPSGRYLAIFDSLGNAKILDRPSVRGILCHDGLNAYWADGSGAKKIAIPNLAQNSTPSSDGVVVWNQSTGSIFRKNSTHPTDTTYLRSVNGKVEFVPFAFAGPSAFTGYGFSVRDPFDEATETPPAMRFIGGPADSGYKILTLNNGAPSSLASGAENYVLTIENSAPVWKAPSTGAVAVGGSSVGFSGVVGSNTSASVANVRAPVISLADASGDVVTVTDVNVSASLPAALGIGGLDVGSENANTWYYLYVVSNGTDVAAVISSNASSPSLTNLGAYTYYALVSVFRNNASSNITDYIQRGRDFWIVPHTVAEAVSITTSYAAIATVALNSVIPPIVKHVSGSLGGSQSANEALSVITSIASTIAGIGGRIVPFFQYSSANFEGFTAQSGPFDRVPIEDPSSPTLYWKGHQASSKRRLVISGYGI